MTPLLSRPSWTIVALAAALALMAAPSHGQLPPLPIPEEDAITLQVKEFGAPIPPLTGLATVEVHVMYKCESFYGGGVLGGEEARQLVFSLTPKQPYVLATLEDFELTIAPTPQDCAPGATGLVMTNLTVGFTRDAPAFTDVEAVEVKVQTTTSFGNTVSASENATAQPGYFGSISASIKGASVAVTPPGGTAHWNITLRNQGNTHSMFMSTVGGVPQAWDTSAAHDFPFLDPGQSTDLHLTLPVPQTAASLQEGERIDLVYEVFAHDAEMPEFRTDTKTLGLEVEVEMPVETEGSPGLAAGAALALAAVALARRRHR